MSVLRRQKVVDMPKLVAKDELPPPQVVEPLVVALVVDITFVNSNDGVPPLVVNISIDHREQFTTKRNFQSRNKLLVWVREAAKLGFCVIIGKTGNGGNDKNAFVTLICKKIWA